MIPRISFKSPASDFLAIPLRFPLPYTTITNPPILYRSRPVYGPTRTHYHFSSSSKMSSVTTRSQSRASASASTPPGPAPTDDTTSTRATAQSPTSNAEPDMGPVYFWREYGSPYDFLSQWYPSAFTAPGIGIGMLYYFLFPALMSSLGCRVSHQAPIIQYPQERWRKIRFHVLTRT